MPSKIRIRIRPEFPAIARAEKAWRDAERYAVRCEQKYREKIRAVLAPGNTVLWQTAMMDTPRRGSIMGIRRLVPHPMISLEAFDLQNLKHAPEIVYLKLSDLRGPIRAATCCALCKGRHMQCMDCLRTDATP